MVQQAPPSPSTSSKLDADVDDPDVPEVARRLWSELLCKCHEPDCQEPPLAHCKCADAARERQRILDEVRRLGFGSAARDDATFAAISAKYVEQHGPDSTLAAAQSRQRLSWLLSLGAAFVFIGAVVAFAEWLRRRRSRVVATAPTSNPSRKWHRARKKREVR